MSHKYKISENQKIKLLNIQRGRKFNRKIRETMLPFLRSKVTFNKNIQNILSKAKSVTENEIEIQLQLKLIMKMKLTVYKNSSNL